MLISLCFFLGIAIKTRKKRIGIAAFLFHFAAHPGNGHLIEKTKLAKKHEIAEKNWGTTCLHHERMLVFITKECEKSENVI